MGNVVRGAVAFIPSDRCQQYLVGDLKEMPHDCTVDLSSRQLRRFPIRACAFRELVKLYLSDNHLSSLPPELHNLQKLQLLALDFNCFEELPSVVCSLRQLNILYLGNNRLYKLPKELAKLSELKTLWLETNCFITFPSVVCKLPNLKTLHLGYNQFRSLPGELVRLDELRSIWLAGNLLNEFPPVLLEMHYLEVIDVDRNRIRQFPALTQLRGLKLVIYDHNPCVNAPLVGEGVRRVGRWADCSEEEDDEAEGKVTEASLEVRCQLPETE
ncbi:leucine-rich repeat-containing protein 10 [Astyanax mexicanus]|uniref:Leucine rich repeat containing 10 n=1 Tax=Astyanax mexicanus TaxID=7994 RepID=A0A8B9HKJ1_ASTMX|nr:leucine-rich repeat-containing protein 10 [Astyanax mexicanus]XP_015460602.3 leucine-rich repeat-containing protein 10 [Astyanax mexicanus]KAG9280940.1 leucine-rich repeat-containing protein 10 [Astyanax mexicanus]